MNEILTYQTSVAQTAAAYRGKLAQPSQGAGPDAEIIRQKLAVWGGLAHAARSTCTAEDLASRRIDLKAWLSSVAMHLGVDARNSLFAQLDRVLQFEDWEVDDELPALLSWRTLARLIIYAKPKKLPSLTFRGGNTVASWGLSDIRITVECLAKDEVSWVASRSVEGKTEASAGDAVVRRLPLVLVPYNDKSWLFENAG